MINVVVNIKNCSNSKADRNLIRDYFQKISLGTASVFVLEICNQNKNVLSLFNTNANSSRTYTVKLTVYGSPMGNALPKAFESLPADEYLTVVSYQLPKDHAAEDEYASSYQPNNSI